MTEFGKRHGKIIYVYVKLYEFYKHYIIRSGVLYIYIYAHIDRHICIDTYTYTNTHIHTYIYMELYTAYGIWGNHQIQ